MREKLLWSAVFLLGLTLAASYAQTPARSDSTPGRFRVVTLPQSGNQRPSAIRVDTATGKTWILAITSTSEEVWAELRDQRDLPRQ